MSKLLEGYLVDSNKIFWTFLNENRFFTTNSSSSWAENHRYVFNQETELIFSCLNHKLDIQECRSSRTFLKRISSPLKSVFHIESIFDFLRSLIGTIDSVEKIYCEDQFTEKLFHQDLIQKTPSNNIFGYAVKFVVLMKREKYVIPI